MDQSLRVKECHKWVADLLFAICGLIELRRMEGRRSRSRGVDVRKPEIKAEETPQPTTTIYEEEEEEEEEDDDGTLDGGVGLRNSNGRDHGFLPLLRGENKRKRDPRGGSMRNLKQKKKGADMENADSSRKTDVRASPLALSMWSCTGNLG
jgi:hypothetical protein